MAQQVWRLLAGVLLCTWIVVTCSHAWLSHQGAVAQLQSRNDEGARLLAEALSRPDGDMKRAQQTASMLFDAGQYGRLRLLSVNGEPWFELDRPARRSDTPPWTVRWFAVDAMPGIAPINDDRTRLGSVELSSPPGGAADRWWADCLAVAGWLAVLVAAALATSWGLLRAWLRPLDAAMAQIQAVGAPYGLPPGESRSPGLRHLTHSMNNVVQRLQLVFARQAAQVEELRERAHIDLVTGLANRRLFVGQLNAALVDGSRHGAGLLIVRVLDLAAMNQRLGHAGTDRLLGGLGEVLQAYPRRVAGALTGRLNGCDFALYLPADGMASDTARSLVEALRAVLATVDLGAELVVGGVDRLGASSGGEALARADLALARAEERGSFAIEMLGANACDASTIVGERVWHRRLSEALADGDGQLVEFQLLDCGGRLLHLECAMRLKWRGAEGFQPPTHWLAMASRCGLVSQVDLMGLSLALAATARDGMPRCVNMSVASLCSAGFVSAVAERLAAAPQHAARLSIDLRGVAAQRHGARLRQASAQWRRLGIKLGLVHVGATVAKVSMFQSLGIDHVKIDAAYVRDVARDPQVRDFAGGLAGLLRGMGIQVFAEGVTSAEDLAGLWELGFSGASGPAVRGGPHLGNEPAVVRDGALA